MQESLLERGRVHDFILVNNWGKQVKAALFEAHFFDQLNYVHARHPSIFPSNICSEDNYGILWPGCQGSSTEAANQGVPSEII
jgi:hypothetical protein